MSVARVMRAARKKINAAIEAALQSHNDIYEQEVTAHQTEPVGSKKRRGEMYKGEIVKRSAPDEYPWKEFQVSSSHMQVGIRRGDMVGRWGVTEEGMPLIHLAYGTHHVSGEPFMRKGPVDSWFDNEDAIRAAAINAAESESG